MPRRPDVFDRERFEQSLREQGCSESFVSPVTSDFRLFVPVLLRDLGPDRILDMMNSAREELGLREQDAAWKVAAKYIHGWATQCVEEYKA